MQQEGDAILKTKLLPLGLVALGIYVSAQFWSGPIEASTGKGHAIADLANGLVDAFGPMGATGIVMAITLGLAAAIIIRKRRDQAKRKQV